jgi:hypothetical protein
MPNLIKAFAVGISLFATTALAQEQNQNKRFITTQACDPVMEMSAIIVGKYKEQPLFQGDGLQFAAPTGQPYQSGMMFFVNQESGTWSLVSLYSDGTACMVANGTKFEPYTGPKIDLK